MEPTENGLGGMKGLLSLLGGAWLMGFVSVLPVTQIILLLELGLNGFKGVVFGGCPRR